VIQTVSEKKILKISFHVNLKLLTVIIAKIQSVNVSGG